jgi:hypothetical protein
MKAIQFSQKQEIQNKEELTRTYFNVNHNSINVSTQDMPNARGCNTMQCRKL